MNIFDVLIVSGMAGAVASVVLILLFVPKNALTPFILAYCLFGVLALVGLTTKAVGLMMPNPCAVPEDGYEVRVERGFANANIIATAHVRTVDVPKLYEHAEKKCEDGGPNVEKFVGGFAKVALMDFVRREGPAFAKQGCFARREFSNAPTTNLKDLQHFGIDVSLVDIMVVCSHWRVVL